MKGWGFYTSQVLEETCENVGIPESFIYFYFVSIGGSACTYGCAQHACSTCRGRRCCWVPGTTITEGCKQSRGCWDSCSGRLEKHGGSRLLSCAALKAAHTSERGRYQSNKHIWYLLREPCFRLMGFLYYPKMNQAMNGLRKRESNGGREEGNGEGRNE